VRSQSLRHISESPSAGREETTERAYMMESVTVSVDRAREPTKGFDDIAVELLSVAISPDGAFVLSATSNYAMSGEVKLWNIAEGRLAATLPHGDVPASLAYARNGKQLAVGLRGRLSAESVMIWEVPVLADRGDQQGTGLRERLDQSTPVRKGEDVLPRPRAQRMCCR
jgi:hypothetical protein